MWNEFKAFLLKTVLQERLMLSVIIFPQGVDCKMCIYFSAFKLFTKCYIIRYQITG